MEPEQLLAMLSAQASGAEAVAGDRNLGTIASHKSARTTRLRKVVGAPEALVGIPCPPDRPVKLVTIPRPREQLVRVIRQLLEMQILLPFGPRAPPTAWESTIQPMWPFWLKDS